MEYSRTHRPMFEHDIRYEAERPDEIEDTPEESLDPYTAPPNGAAYADYPETSGQQEHGDDDDHPVHSSGATPPDILYEQPQMDVQPTLLQSNSLSQSASDFSHEVGFNDRRPAASAPPTGIMRRPGMPPLPNAERMTRFELMDEEETFRDAAASARALGAAVRRSAPTSMSPPSNQRSMLETGLRARGQLRAAGPLPDPSAVSNYLIGAVPDPREEPAGRRARSPSSVENGIPRWEDPSLNYGDSPQYQRRVGYARESNSPRVSTQVDPGKESIDHLTEQLLKERLQTYGFQPDGSPIFYRFASTAFQHVLADLLPAEERNHMAHLARLVVAMRMFHGMGFLVDLVNGRQTFVSQ